MKSRHVQRKGQKRSGPVIVITGASQGIGEAIAKAFATDLQGIRLALVARNEKKIVAVARACRNAGAEAEVFPCDASNESAVAQMGAAVVQRFGQVDVLVNNAGKFFGASFLETKVADFDTQIAANLRSVFLVSKVFVPGMVQRGKGDIFNMSSIAGLEPYPNGTAYCAAKYGVTGLTAVMREELKDKGVRVCCIYPGATWTPSWSSSGVKSQRIMPAADIAQAILAIHRLDRRTVVEALVLRPQLGDV